MTTDLNDFRLVTASAYPGMMAPLTGHPSCVCVLSGNDDRSFLGSPTRLLSLEGLDGVRRRWRFGDVSRLADFVPKALAELPPDNRPILLVPPRTNAGWQAAAQAWPGRADVAASPQSVVDPIATNKIYVRAELRRRGVPVPDALVVDRQGPDFRTLRARLGTPFVVQSPNGAGGQGTFLVEDEAGLVDALESNPHVPQWLVSRFIGDTTINIAGLVHRDGVVLLPASVQTSGIPELGVDFGAYCGSDFGVEHIRPELLRSAYRHAAVVGEWLRELGHLGLYGADIALDRNDYAFLEVNPRIQGSSWLLSRLQRQVGAAACLEQHVHALIGDPLDPTVRQLDPAETQLSGSHLLVRWQGPPGVILSLPPAGAVADAGPAGPTGRVELSALPDIGVTIHPGAILGRLESDRHLAEPDGRSLLPETVRLVAELHASVEVAPV